MIRFFLASLAVLLLATPSSGAKPALELELMLFQEDPATQTDVLLLRDTAWVVHEYPALGFFLTFSLDIELTEIDSVRAQYAVHLVTLGPPTSTVSRVFTVEYGLPARIEGLNGKNGATYDLVLKPLSQVDYDLSCDYDYRNKETFRFDPSAHMDLHYVPNSLGDFFWGTAKSLLEDQYRSFQALLRFNLPGKYNVILAPCFIPGILWDDRFGMSVDPTRKSSYVMFTRGANAMDPFVVNHLALLRNWGYAPPFVSEGLANFGSYGDFDLIRLRQRGPIPTLDSLLTTSTYLQTDPYMADRCAASFMRYVFMSRGRETIRNLYERSHDLNLRQMMESELGATIADLESEWLNHLDTITVDLARIAYHAEVAEALFRYNEMLSYAQSIEPYVQSRTDSLRFAKLLSRAAFYSGDYYKATEAQEMMVSLDSSSVLDRMTLATYRQINGYYEEARADLSMANALDTANQLVIFNTALNSIYRGDTAHAVSLLVDLISRAPGGLHEARIVLAEHLGDWPDEKLASRRPQLLNEAMTFLETVLRSDPTSSQSHMWAGIAALLSGDEPRARDHLELAQFLEFREFHRGIIELWLGKTADAQRRRDEAVVHYNRVLGMAASAAVQGEAKRYLEQPFKTN